MYSVYYVPGIKIGCTTNLIKRVEEEQGYKDYQVLFQSPDIKKASNAERYYQEKLGYKQDQNTYETLKAPKPKTIMANIHVTSQTVTFKTKEKITISYLESLGTIKVNEVDVVITTDTANWILKNLKKSQWANMGSFVYTQALLKTQGVECNTSCTSNTPSIYDDIRSWADAKGIYDSGDSKTQYLKLMEEAGELSEAILKNDKPEVIDAIGDMVVVLTNLAKLEGLNIEDCVNSAYNVIKGRTGSMVNGTFVKDK